MDVLSNRPECGVAILVSPMPIRLLPMADATGTQIRSRPIPHACGCGLSRATIWRNDLD
jgi:hypothetical protein